MRQLPGHPPCDGVQGRQTYVERQLAKIGRYREQNGRQWRIDEFEITAGPAGIKVRPLQHLLSGPEPERIVLGLSAPPNLGTENVGRQRDTTYQEKDIERSSQRRIS